MSLRSLNSSTCLLTPAVVRKSNQIIVAMHNATVRGKKPKRNDKGLYAYQQEDVDNINAYFGTGPYFEGQYEQPDGSFAPRMATFPDPLRIHEVDYRKVEARVLAHDPGKEFTDMIAWYASKYGLTSHQTKNELFMLHYGGKGNDELPYEDRVRAWGLAHHGY